MIKKYLPTESLCTAASFIDKDNQSMPHTVHNLKHQSAIKKLALLMAADLILFWGTNVRDVASYVVVVGLLLLVATIYQLVRSILAIAGIYGLGISRSRRLAGSLSGLVGVLVALQSIGELSSRDALVMVPLVILGYLYGLLIQTRRHSPVP